MQATCLDGQAAFSLTHIEQAAERLAGFAVVTPLLRSEALDALGGMRLVFKVESLQRTGSFKFRGAYNAIRALSPSAVVAFSSGNHAQGVACAARLLDVPATIVMPSDAPPLKIRRTRDDGATVILYDRYTEDRERIGADIAENTGAALIRPYDDHLVMAGQGTVGLELSAQMAALGLRPQAVLVPCSGGGLIAGTATALKAADPDLRIFSAEPEHLDDTARSLAAGQRVSNAPGVRSICDGLMAATPGEQTFAVNRRIVEAGFAVGEEDVRAAMRLAFLHLKLVLEPSGAVALAAALAEKERFAGQTVGIVLSGGNVDPRQFAAILAEDAMP